ncbi:hypothetical protein, partial [Methylobacterium radiotolerans]|uniref:hypothetical protein n=1 Tax=Methylobacterium radiotolerans TaxID=31998 RepID=UPI001AEE5C2B
HLPQLGDDILRLVPLRSHLSVLILARKPYLRADHFIGGRSVTADAEVTALLRRLRVLHQKGQDKSQTAGLLVTKLKRLFRLRDQRDCNIQRVGERD